ncbi:toprim domain-containing protein [Novosphingobium sp. G106]|nr:toprim domain-containing protein [Novosphingobium sp. G106]
MCRCPAHADREPSLSIRLGNSALLFKCFAGCDTLDVLRELRTIDTRVFETVSGAGDASQIAARQDWLRGRARDLWDQARPLGGTLAQAYLESRSLNARAQGLRFARRAPLGPRRSVIYRPALIAALHDAGRLVAVQRMFFEEGLGQLASDLGNPRRLLGRPLGGAVILTRASEVLGLAEGVETAMSAALLLGIPVWATLGSERLPHITVPESVTRLLILPDNDRAGRLGARKAMAAYARSGRTVETVWPPSGFNDWNDVLRSDGDSALSAV